jgi:hypothetical protein
MMPGRRGGVADRRRDRGEGHDDRGLAVADVSCSTASYVAASRTPRRACGRRSRTRWQRRGGHRVSGVRGSRTAGRRATERRGWSRVSRYAGTGAVSRSGGGTLPVADLHMAVRGLVPSCPFPALPACPPTLTDAGAPAPSGTLRHLLRATPRLAPERAAALLAGVARAAAAWHARGAAHGALTPDRVLLAHGDAVTLAPPPRQDGSPAPWPTYLAPEQIDGRSGDARSDVYALGLLGWEMLAGHQPWEGESLYGVVVKQREHDLPRLSTLRPGLPRALVGAIEGCLHKAPGDRWQTMAEFVAALAPALPAAAPAADAGRAPPRDVYRDTGRDERREAWRDPHGDALRAPEAVGRAPYGPPPGPVAGAVARAAAAGAVPGAGGARGDDARVPAADPYARRTPRAGAPEVDADRDRDDAEADDAERPATRAARRPDAPSRRGRRLTAAVLAVALLGRPARPRWSCARATPRGPRRRGSTRSPPPARRAAGRRSGRPPRRPRRRTRRPPPSSARAVVACGSPSRRATISPQRATTWSRPRRRGGRGSAGAAADPAPRGAAPGPPPPPDGSPPRHDLPPRHARRALSAASAGRRHRLPAAAVGRALRRRRRPPGPPRRRRAPPIRLAWSAPRPLRCRPRGRTRRRRRTGARRPGAR